MSKYKYTALDRFNNKVGGEVDAKDEADFRIIMRNKGLVPVKFSMIERGSSAGYRLRPNEVADFSRQFSSMLGSGITTARALEILQKRDIKPGMKNVVEKLQSDVRMGLTMSEAMRLQKGSFPELLVNMYASGEASGQLEQVSGKMAEHYEKEHRLNSKVKSAMTYPIILGVATLVVVMLIFTVILPSFFDMLKDITLPLITQIVISISEFLQKDWYWVIMGVVLLVAVFRYLKTIYGFALRYDRLKLRLPVIGKLLKIIYTARFSRTMSSLYSSGVSMIHSLEIAATIIGNKFIEKQFEEVIKDVRNGEPLSLSVGKVVGFDSKLPGTILVGEESGRLDSMLTSTAEGFDYEAEMATGRLVQLLEPAMIVIMAVVIGVIMIAVMLPLMTLYQNMGSM